MCPLANESKALGGHSREAEVREGAFANQTVHTPVLRQTVEPADAEHREESGRMEGEVPPDGDKDCRQGEIEYRRRAVEHGADHHEDHGKKHQESEGDFVGVDGSCEPFLGLFCGDANLGTVVSVCHVISP